MGSMAHAMNQPLLHRQGEFQEYDLEKNDPRGTHPLHTLQPKTSKRTERVKTAEFLMISVGCLAGAHVMAYLAHYAHIHS